MLIFPFANVFITQVCGKLYPSKAFILHNSIVRVFLSLSDIILPNQGLWIFSSGDNERKDTFLGAGRKGSTGEGGLPSLRKRERGRFPEEGEPKKDGEGKREREERILKAES